MDGVRALAVLLVMGHHLWSGRVSGGVDVFFVLSAFLLTLSFLNKADRGGHWSLAETLLGRFRRLVPMLATTILGVLLLGRILLPPIRWRQLFEQSVASITFTQNSHLAGLSVDYYAAEQAEAPILQHFWSMSIQGQVFVLWPLLMALALLLYRRTGWSVRFWVIAIFGTVGAYSFAASVTAVEAEPVAAYFFTIPRLWEFVAGTLLAVGISRIRLGDRLGTVLGWAGMVALIACGFTQPTPAYFPGWLSLWPVLAAVAVIVGGSTLSGGGRYGVGAVLDVPLVRWISDHSFGLYLWHWPLLVMWLSLTEGEHAGLVGGVGIIAASVGLTLLTERLIDQVVAIWQAGKGRHLRTLAVMASSAAVVLVPVSLWDSAVTRQAAAVGAQSLDDNPGARSLRPDYVPSAPASEKPRLRPAGTELHNEWANLPDRCTADWKPAGLAGDNCLEYVPQGKPTKTILVLGDSHSQQWLAAVQPIAEEQGWHVVSVLLHGCRYTGQLDEAAPVCNEFNAEAQRLALELEPDAVVTVASRTFAGEETENLEPGYREGVQPLLDKGIEVVAIRDNPRFDYSVPECVQRHPDSEDRCSMPVGDAMAVDSPMRELDGMDGLVQMDMTDELCPSGQCPGVIGNVYVYMDRQHLTKTYVESMTDDFAEDWFVATGWQRR
ncbi:acyltransferase family protein [Propionibacteriaceae bacterium Y1685]